MRYASSKTWAESFKKSEGISVHGSTIRKYLKGAGKIGKNGRNRIGTVLKKSFYCEVDVREACDSLLQIFPLANE